MKALFIGNYPNTVNPTWNCFFQTLIHAFANMGTQCTVISPISLTHYRKSFWKIPRADLEITSEGNKVEVFHPRYVSYSSKRIWKYNTQRWSESSYQKAVLKTIEKQGLQFDFTYGHFFLGGGLAAAKVGRLYNKPSFIANGEDSFVECVSNPYGELAFNDLEGITGIISVSTKNKNELLQQEVFRDIPILVAPNGVDASMLARRKKEKCRRVLNIPEDKFVVGFVGSFENRKGDSRLYEAVKSLDNVYVAFAGKGTRKYSGSKVLFCDSVNRDMIPVFLHAMDVFCLPTLSEGCSNAIVEALACGLPIISSNLPFNDDILNDTNSIRIDPKNIEEIRAAIKTLRDVPALRKRLAAGAVETASRLSIDERAKKIAWFMEDLIDAR